MGRFMIGLLLSVGLAAATAVGQRINISVNQRPGGGETVGAGTPGAPEAAMAGMWGPPPPKPQDVTADAAKRVTDELLASNRLSPANATEVLATLAASSVDVSRMPQEFRSAYYMTASIAAAVTGDVDRARNAARRWQVYASRDAGAYRNSLFLSFLAGDRDGADLVLSQMDRPGFEPWQPWRAYMKGLLPLMGARPNVSWPLAGGKTTSTAAARGKVMVLYFWTLDASVKTLPHPQGLPPLAHQVAMTGTYRGQPVEFVGVNLDSDAGASRAADAVKAASGAPPQVLGADGPGARIAGTLGISAAPTGVVLAGDGRVLFAGDPGAWEIHTAIAFGLKELPSIAPAAAPPAATEDEEAAARRLHDQGWDTLRLGVKTHSPVHRQKGLEILREVVRKYPNTRAAAQAQQDIDFATP